MIYYRRYVGDYLKKTARLSMLEHGAYSLLLDYYYVEELPIPIGIEEVCRMVRAIRPEERAAVEKVLATYFSLGPDGYHNPRADEEIQVALQARANGAKGGRPRTQQITGSATLEETETGTESITGDGGGDGGGSGHPSTTSLQPSTTNPQPKKSTVGLKPDLKHLRAQAVEVLAFLNEKAGKGYKPVSANIDLIVNLLKAGATVEDMRAVIAKKVRDWNGRELMNEYLRPATLFGPKNFWQKYEGELGPK